MKKIMCITAAIYTFAVLFISCAKDPATTATQSANVNTGNVPKTNSLTNATQNRIVSLCGRKFNYVDPPAGTWALAIKVDNVIKKIGIPVVTDVSFTEIDWVKFEFSGQYADAANSIKLYRVRRTSDNKYLHGGLGFYYEEMRPENVNYQLWAFEGMSDNSYRLTTPKITSTYCLFGHTYLHNGGYRSGCTYLENPSASNFNFKFYFSPLSSLPPNTN